MHLGPYLFDDECPRVFLKSTVQKWSRLIICKFFILKLKLSLCALQINWSLQNLMITLGILMYMNFWVVDIWCWLTRSILYLTSGGILGEILQILWNSLGTHDDPKKTINEKRKTLHPQDQTFNKNIPPSIAPAPLKYNQKRRNVFYHSNSIKSFYKILQEMALRSWTRKIYENW